MGLPRITQSKSYILSLTEYKWEFQNDALSGTILHALLDHQTMISGQNANDKMPLPKTSTQTMLTPTPKPQTHKSVAFQTLAFFPWHSDQITQTIDALVYIIITSTVSSHPADYITLPLSVSH